MVVGTSGQSEGLIPGLSLCDGIPCYYGVVPGITSVKEAETKFFGLQNVSFTYDANNPGAIFSLDIGLEKNSNIQLGDLSTFLGAPCADDSPFVIYYRYTIVEIAQSNKPPTPLSKVRSLGLVSPDICSRNMSHPWHGFRRFP
jgi:hypothetical protein